MVHPSLGLRDIPSDLAPSSSSGTVRQHEKEATTEMRVRGSLLGNNGESSRVREGHHGGTYNF